MRNSASILPPSSGDAIVWVLPGSVAQLPGRLRISLTANDVMVERSLPVFAQAIREVAA
ncbi:hypothetical protein [Rhizobium sp. LjRoot258]|uniref:hypothetical protein n=1 Tax=Rhizobium sp. LjRoot258 TaxID=3342299 RepID=UPI003ECF11AF